MGIVSRFESAMQGLIEGSFGRVFRTRLQPVELSRKLERAMEANLEHASVGRTAPNVYDVYLGPRDYDHYSRMAPSLSRQLADSLIRVARERGYRLTTRPYIHFHDDDRIVTGQVRIETSFGGSGAASGSADDGDMDETRAINQAEVRQLESDIAAAQAEPLPPAWLTLIQPSRGEAMRLERPTIHIGRHLSNEIVVNDKRVSRYHAEIRYEHGQFVLYDLGSTNGVRINGVATRKPVPLRTNDIITVGSHEFVFQRR